MSKSKSMSVLIAGLFAANPDASLRGEDETEAEEVTLPVDWAPGTRYRVELSKERSDTQAGKTTSAKATTIIDVEVKQRLEEGYVLVWTYGESQLAGGAEKIPWLREVSSLTKGQRVELRTDRTGTPQTVLNLEEILALSRKAASKMVESRVTPEERKACQIALDEILKPGLLRQETLKAPQYFYSLCGSSLVPAQPSEYEDLLPNPFGGEPFPCKGRIVLREVDRDKAEAKLDWTQTLDAERTAAILKKWSSEVASKLGKPGPKPEDLAGFNVEDVASYVIDTRTGLPKQVEQSRTSSAGERKRVDTLRFKLLPPAGK